MQEHLNLGEQGRFRSGKSSCWWGSARSGRVAGGVLRKPEGLYYLPLVWALVESWSSAEEKDQVAVGASPHTYGLQNYRAAGKRARNL